MVNIRSVNAHEVFRIFINRQAEVDRLVDLIRTSEEGRIGAILAWPDSGLTASLRQAQSRLDQRLNVVPVDLSNRQPDAFLLQTIQYILGKGKEYSQEILRPLARPGKKEVLVRLLGAGSGAVPVLGSTLSQLSDIAVNLVSPDLDNLQYNKKLSDIFNLLSKTGRTCIVADHFQKAQPSHLAQIANTLNANPGVAVLAAQNTVEQVPSVQILDKTLEPYLGALAEFPQPDEHLAELILSDVAKKAGIVIQASQVSDIRDGLHAFLSQIYRLLINNFSQPEPLDQIHIDILCILKTADVPLGASMLFHSLVKGKLFMLDGTAFRESMALLEEHGLVTLSQASGLEISIALSSQGEARAQRELESNHRILLFTEILYRGLTDLIDSQKLDSNIFAPLVYRLAGTVDQNAQDRWRIATIKSCIATSDFFEASAILDRVETTLPRQNDDDTLTLIAALVTTKKYDRALKLCSRISDSTLQIAILRAVLLYRSLKLQNAHEEMTSLLSIVQDPEERCFLSVFFIALCIDRSHIDENARQLIASADQFSDTRYYGYLLNIIAATQLPNEAVETCRLSFWSFEKNLDEFGLAGACANEGVHLIKAGRFHEGLETSLSAYERLSKYGIQHIHLVANNIASASLMLGKVADAERWVRMSLNLLQTSTIRINALSNLAAIEFIRGNTDRMVSAMVEAVKQAGRQPIGHARKRACANLKIFAHDQMEFPDTILDVCGDDLDETEQHPALTAPGPEALEKDRLAYLVEAHKPPTNQYWYPNPMGLFQSKSLAVEAFG